MKPKTFDRIERYIRRNDTYHLAEFAGEDAEPRSSAAFQRPPRSLRIALCRAFNRAREQGFNRGKKPFLVSKAEA